MIRANWVMHREQERIKLEFAYNTEIINKIKQIGDVAWSKIQRQLSYPYQNQMVNAAQLFFKLIHGSALITEQLERPRRKHKLPNVLSKEKIKLILHALATMKHRTMLCLIYACGLFA